MKKSISVLFVGNSYTYFNDMPKTSFVKEAEAAGVKVSVTAVTKGGWYLSKYADENDEYGKRLRKVISGKHYDFAVLQDQSLCPIKDEERFLSGAGALKDIIDAEKLVLYATWGRNDGSPDLEALGMTRKEMTERLSAAYNKAGERYGMLVAEVGRAFLEYPEKDALYDADKSHPSPLGSEIAARVIFAAMGVK